MGSTLTTQGIPAIGGVVFTHHARLGLGRLLALRDLRAFCTCCGLRGLLRITKGSKKLKANKDQQTKKQNIHKAAATAKAVAAKQRTYECACQQTAHKTAHAAKKSAGAAGCGCGLGLGLAGVGLALK